MDAGASTSIKNSQGYTPKELAEAEDKVDVVEFMNRKEAEKTINRKQASEADRTLLQEQRLHNKFLDDYFTAQEKQTNQIRVLRDKFMNQTTVTSSLFHAYGEIKRQLAYLEEMTNRLTDMVGDLIPTTKSSTRFTMSKLPHIT